MFWQPLVVVFVGVFFSLFQFDKTALVPLTGGSGEFPYPVRKQFKHSFWQSLREYVITDVPVYDKPPFPVHYLTVYEHLRRLTDTAPVSSLHSSGLLIVNKSHRTCEHIGHKEFITCSEPCFLPCHFHTRIQAVIQYFKQGLIGICGSL